METFSHVPPGFRFHPTDEELVDYYLRKKIASKRIDLDVIKDVDLYKIEPWDLQDLCRIGTEEQNEWYFFSHKDKKYPTGTRTNRATKAGFWKATGRDKGIYARHSLIGMRKTLVFYKGRAPNGQKSDWIMHEYRLETNENGPPQEEGWVVCRVFKKRLPTIRRLGDYDSPCWYDDQASYMAAEMESPRRIPQQYSPYLHHYPCKQELELQYNMPPHHPDPSFLHLPPLESPKVPQHSGGSTNCNMAAYGYDSNSSGSTFPSSSALTQEIMIHQSHLQNVGSLCNNMELQSPADQQLTDWRVLDKFVASQLSHEDVAKVANYNSSSSGSGAFVNVSELLADESKRSAIVEELSSRSCQIDLWK